MSEEERLALEDAAIAAMRALVDEYGYPVSDLLALVGRVTG